MDAANAQPSLQRAIDSFCEARQHGKIFNKKLKQIEDQMARLEDEHTATQHEYKSWLFNVFHNAILPYARAWNLQFAEEIQTRLPSELRKMVYDNLWDEDTLIKYVHWFQRAAYVLIPLPNPRLPHFTDPAFVGKATALEIVAAWYEAQNEPSHVIHGPENIKKYLCSDAFHVGFDPTTTVRSLVVHCKVDHYRTKRLHYEHSRKCQHTANERLYTTQKELKDGFDALCYIKDITKLQVRVVLTQRNIRRNVLSEVLDSLRYAYDGIRKGGGEITVLWTYRGHWPDSRGPAIGEAVVFKELNNFFDPEISLSVWEHEFSQFVDECPYILARHHRLDNEPSETNSHNTFVHGMWEDSEYEYTTEGAVSDDESDNDNL